MVLLSVMLEEKRTVKVTVPVFRPVATVPSSLTMPSADSPMLSYLGMVPPWKRLTMSTVSPTSMTAGLKANVASPS